jgi:alpha-L-fucosidase
MESVVNGQRIQKYAVEVRDGSGWRRVAEGTTVGHKKIDRFAPTTSSAARLIILSASGTPSIREFQLYLR